MKIDIRNITEGTSSYQKTFELSEELANFGSIEPMVEAVVTHKRRDSFIETTVEYKATITLNCGRCLNDYKYVINDSTIFLIESERNSIEDEGDFDIYTYVLESDIITFDQTIYDDIMVKIPGFKICSENCDGGIYQTEQDSPKPEIDDCTIDARWAKLTKLKN